jgi:hypothetical protein
MMTNIDTRIDPNATETVDETATDEAKTVVAEQVEPVADAVEAATGETTEQPVATEAIETVAAEPSGAAAENAEATIESAGTTAEHVEATTEAAAEATDAEASSDAAEAEATTAGPVNIVRVTERVNQIEQEVAAAPNQATFLGRVTRLLNQIAESDEAQELRERLNTLQAGIHAQIEERKGLKEAIVAKAEELSLASEWKATGEAMRGLFEDWKAVGSAGREVEDPLWQRFQAARDTFSKRRNEWFEGRQKEWAANREKKEELCGRAEALADSTEWRSTADAMRNLMAEWKKAGSAGRELDDALWARFRAAQQVFFDRRSATFDENKTKKDELCQKAEALSDSTDWKATAEELKSLQAGWKEIGPVGNREEEDVLWNRFRAATQAFFERRGSNFADRDREEGENLRRKEELCVAAEQLANAVDSAVAIEEIKALQAEWKTVGPVRRDRSDALWARFRAACDRVFENSTSQRAVRQVEWSSKMREALGRKEEQLARLQDAIELDLAAVDAWEHAVATKPDPNISTKIANTNARIADKRARAAELKASIDDILAKMG